MFGLNRPGIQGVLTAIVLVIIIAIVIAVLGCSDESIPMAATVRIKPGAILVINEDTFPWYGLIITLGGSHSTKHHFGDPNWFWLSKDSVLLPSEETGPGFAAFIDGHGNEWEGKPSKIVVTKVTIEAKTDVDGPYDLHATFNFSTSDPIIDNAIGRTNISNNGSHATPYPLTEKLNRKPTVLITTSPESNTEYQSVRLEHHEPKYDEVIEFVSDYPQNTFGSYILPIDAYRKVQALLGEISELTPQEQAALDRWQEQWSHWNNVDAFKAATSGIGADRIIDKEELQNICLVLEQWVDQMKKAKDYIQEYRKDDPETVDKNAGLGNLEHEAERALALLNAIECG